MYISKRQRKNLEVFFFKNCIYFYFTLQCCIGFAIHRNKCSKKMEGLEVSSLILFCLYLLLQRKTRVIRDECSLPKLPCRSLSAVQPTSLTWLLSSCSVLPTLL